MNLLLNGIFIVTCYPLIFFLYFMMRKVHDKGVYCFGSTLKKEFREDSAVKAIVADYHSKLKKTMIVLAILPFFAFCIPWTSICMTFWMIWILVICFYPMVFMAKGNQQIVELKQERGWNEASEVAYTELKSAVVPSKVKLMPFLPTLVLSTIPVIVAFVMFPDADYAAFIWIVVLFALCTYLFYGCAVWTDKQKITIICEDSDTNVNFARAKKQVWKNSWVLCAWINTIYTWILLFFLWKRDWGMMAIVWSSVGYGLVLVGVMIWLVKKLEIINNAYADKRTIVDATEDDKNWIYGMIYYNKNDKHIMVENRMGTGTAMNVATPVAKGMYIFSALLLLIIPITCIWLIMLEFTPIQTVVEDDVIICRHLSVEYEIPLEDIEEYTIITSLPKMTKVNGTGMDNVLSGKFEIYREGMLEAFLNPQNDLFLKIQTDEKMYYISGADDAMTQKVIDAVEGF